MIRAAICVIVPVIALLGWCISLEYPRLTGTIIRVPVEGYDPRSLLSGRYILFSLSMNGKNPCSWATKPDVIEDSCVCYSKGEVGGRHEVSWSGVCSAKPTTCDIFLRGRCSYGRFEAAVDRYYIPEYLSPVLMTAPPDSSIDLAVSADGTGRVLEFFVGDRRVVDYAVEKLNQAVQTPSSSEPQAMVAQ